MNGSTPYDLPLLVYDGDCGFCATSLRALRRTLPSWPQATAWQAVDLGRLGLSADQAQRAAWWVTGDRPPRRGAMAFAALLAWQPARGWRLTGWLLAHPPLSWAAVVVYALVARYRRHLPGGTAACSVSPRINRPKIRSSPTSARR
ncbi:DCC1-like thiol-disulfide oxidoreductase family protein [Microbispora bryophytorum]|uniref:DUF393 domain-containing protein n=1 Tax=Microbispora bryophytorum TaxID=1460882 RepID=A0A8H9LA39_9ACTN|nr:DCC1-like thiol-disulfide oxidoreductase family protein [Microbispora bryophytorum]MBD3136165.1 DUF393 domain-containing protein [Microbispora bryophytorum]GGO04874.1 hypothetical protein GCM10011574_16050 [Microbispora bryophytorum]